MNKEEKKRSTYVSPTLKFKIFPASNTYAILTSGDPLKSPNAFDNVGGDIDGKWD